MYAEKDRNIPGNIFHVDTPLKGNVQYQSSLKIWHELVITCPTTNLYQAVSQQFWDRFFSGWPIFRGEMAV